MTPTLSSAKQTLPSARRLFLCPAIYKCKCEGRLRSKVTSFKHKKSAEDALRAGAADESNIVLPCPQPYCGMPTDAPIFMDFSLVRAGPAIIQKGSSLGGSGRSQENLQNGPNLMKSGNSSMRTETISICNSRESSGMRVTQPQKLIHGSPDARNAVLSSSSHARTVQDLQSVSLAVSGDFEGDVSVEANGLHDVNSSCSDHADPFIEHYISGAEDGSIPNGSQESDKQDSTTQCDSEVRSALSDPLHTTMYEDDTKLGLIFRNHGGIIDFWHRHKVTDAAISDLPKLENAPLTTWKRVREVLYEAEDVVIDKHNMCWESHQHLSFLPNGKLEPCSQARCCGKVKRYGYLRVWSRIKCRLQSPVYGPELFDHYHKQLNRLEQEDEVVCSDVLSGSVFKDIVEDLGGIEAVRHDIFLILSGDGTQPYRSSTYDMWPFISMLANLTPEKRVKTGNMLPIVCIPGPNNPKDILSFLEPFLDEMEELSNGMDCTLWDGRRITLRCHMLLLEGDLAAFAKLCRLKGYNGLRGCMYCLVKAVKGRHPYFPSFTLGTDGRKDINFDAYALKMRNVDETEHIIGEIGDFRQSRRIGAAKDRENKCKEWGINGRSSPFHRSSMIQFRSVPLDYMHLLLINVSSDFVNLSFEREFISRTQERAINKALSAFGSGVSSQSRSPRPLNQRGLFKADEWRFFVLHSSLVVFDKELPHDVLDGWSLFVQIVEMCGRPELTASDVDHLSATAVNFYNLYEATFYEGIPEQLNVCKMTLHLILHLADSVRNCGPPLNVSQFPMERFIVETVYELNARNKAAESVLKHWKFQQSHISYKMRKDIGGSQPPRMPRENLCITSSLPEFVDILLCHPCRLSSVTKFSDALAVNMAQLLADFYEESLGISSSAAQELVMSQADMTCWDRMAFKSQFVDEYRVVHIGSAAHVNGGARRRNYYVAGEYEDYTEEESNGNDERRMLVYFGRVQQFLEHRIFYQSTEQVFLLVFVEWVVNELQTSAQGQVFSTRRRDDPALFRNKMVEGVDVIQRHISVVEKEEIIGKQTKDRTYFVDIHVLREDLLGGEEGEGAVGF